MCLVHPHMAIGYSACSALGHKIDKVVIGCYMKGHLERELFVMILTCESV